MAVKLGELLIKESLLTQTQLDEALQTQVIFGGKLGTVLIEMGLITEDTLAENLGKLISIPCANPGQLQNIPEDIIKIISPELADKHKVVPVAVSGKNLTLAMADPRNLKSIDEISFRSGYIVRPILALEVRLVIALEKYYGIRRTMRYIAPPKQVRDELNQLHIFNPAAVSVAAPNNNDAPDILGFTHPPRGSQPQRSARTEDGEDSEVIAELNDDDQIEELEDEEITLATTAQALINISDRDDVANAVIAYLGANYTRTALFMVVAGQITGWRLAKNGQSIPGFEQFQMPLSEPSVLQTAVESNSYFLGPVPQSGANLALTTFLGRPAPITALLLPMSMMGRVVGLIYVDDASADLSLAVPDLQQLAGKALMAFEILILHNKILRV
ncbi:MAG: general secretion pathway protein GspE [Desulfuromonadales bacterium]|nr:general secretion pathway protein GspE [Desulfuromonadales bacterium]